MPISKLSRKRCKVVDRIMTNHTPKFIRLMKTVAMDIKSYVAIKINMGGCTSFASSKLVKPELLIFRKVVHPFMDDHLNHPMIRSFLPTNMI